MGRPAFQIFNGLAPAGGPKGIPITLDFSTASSIKIDLLPEEVVQAIEFVQGAYVDNSSNGAALTLTFEITGQKLVVPANSQGTWPILAPESTKFTAATTPGAGVAPVLILVNVPLPYSTWGPITVNAPALTPARGAMTNRSGSIAVANTSQQLMAANAARTGLIIENPISAAGQGIGAVETLYINISGAAAVVDGGTSIELAPGGVYYSGAGPVPTSQINVIATSANHRYIAYEL